MKNFRQCIVLAYLLITLLFGCANNSIDGDSATPEADNSELLTRIESLEKRVEQLEKQNGSTSSTPAIDNSMIEISDQTEESSDITGSESYTYYIDDLSDEDVVNECKYYFDNPPAQGQSYEDYGKIFKAPYVNNSSTTYYFYDENAEKQDADRDVITEVSIPGAFDEMNGTIGYSDTAHGVCVEMVIHDYDRAAYIYDSLFNIVTEGYDLSSVDMDDKRQSTEWHSSGLFPGGLLVFMEMNSKADGYHISATDYVQ